MNKGRKISGGKYHSNRKKRAHEKQRDERKTSLGERKTKFLRIRSGAKRAILLKTNFANIVNNGKSQKAEIENVLETPQNKFLARQNRLMKGAIIKTSLGKAKITNRPSREGQINAILID